MIKDNTQAIEDSSERAQPSADALAKDEGYDRGWARQLILVWSEQGLLKLPESDSMRELFINTLDKCFCTVKRKAANSIGDIQIKPKPTKRRDEEPMFSISVGGKEIHYLAATEDMCILLALSYKYLGSHEFAKFAGRMLGIKDDWTG